jgi:hypothetical protein
VQVLAPDNGMKIDYFVIFGAFTLFFEIYAVDGPFNFIPEAKPASTVPSMTWPAKLVYH